MLKPLGLKLLLAGVGLVRHVPWGWSAAVVLGALAYPVSRIANVGWLAIATDLVLLLALAGLPILLSERATSPAGTRSPAR